MTKQCSFDPTKTYAFLLDGGQAPTIEVTESFWRDLMSGNLSSPGAKLLAEGTGWLAAVYHFERDTASWEVHPAGDELLVLLSGVIDVVLETEDGERVIELTEGKACVTGRSERRRGTKGMLLEPHAAWAFIKTYKALLLEIAKPPAIPEGREIVPVLESARGLLVERPALLDEALVRLNARSKPLDGRDAQGAGALSLAGSSFSRPLLTMELVTVIRARARAKSGCIEVERR